MNKTRRWFAVAQGINQDPEFLNLKRQFGAAGVCCWLELLSMLDSSDNYLPEDKVDIHFISGSLGTKPRIIRGSCQLLYRMNWLCLGVDSNNNSFIFAPKWLKYNGNRHENPKVTLWRSKTEPTVKVGPPKPRPKPLSSSLSPKKEIKNPKDICAFEVFWEIYPKKKGKEAARKAWKNLKPDEYLNNTILNKVEEMKNSQDWQKDGGQFIPMPATFLNGKRWEDEGVEGVNRKYSADELVAMLEKENDDGVQGIHSNLLDFDESQGSVPQRGDN